MSSSLLEETYHSTIWHDRQTNAEYVIKRSRHRTDPRTLLRWRNEVDTLTRIGVHSNIVQLVSASEPDLSITLTFVPGRALSTYDPSVLIPHVRQICLQLSRALQHIHALKIVHDDVKPANVVFSAPTDPSKLATPSTVLVDFGACITSGQFTPSGTPWYVSPEFIQRVKGPKTDVWALGITMAWILGEFALPELIREEWILPMIWEDENERGKMDEWLALVERVRENLRMKGGLACVVADMLQPHPEQRIGSDELVDRLEQIS